MNLRYIIFANLVSYSIKHEEFYLNCVYQGLHAKFLSHVDPFPNEDKFQSYKLKKFADDNFKYDENWQKVLQRIEKRN